MDHDSTDARLDGHLQHLVSAGRSGDRLASPRSLVAAFAAGPLTVRRAVERLAHAGLIDTRPGTGNFIAARRQIGRADFSWQTTALGPSRNSSTPVGTAMALDSSPSVAMHSAYPSEELLPVRLVRAALGRVARSSASIDR